MKLKVVFCFVYILQLGVEVVMPASCWAHVQQADNWRAHRNADQNAAEEAGTSDGVQPEKYMTTDLTLIG